MSESETGQQGPSHLPVQRRPLWKDDNHPDRTLDGFMTALDDIVDASATLAKDHPEALDTQLDNYVKLWVETAELLQGARTGDVDVDDPAIAAALQVARTFAYARYGYAIESYACKVQENKTKLQDALPRGWTYELQGSRGMTRPDIIVKDDSSTEVGWFDITSEGQKGHIDKKTGTGWRDKPYVAEVLYPTLDPTEIGTGTLSIGEKTRLRNATRRAQRAWRQFLDRKKDDVLSDWQGVSQGLTSAAAMRSNMQMILSGAVMLREGEKVTPKIATGLLVAMGLNPRNYGFTKAGGKAEGERILRNEYVAKNAET
jgi:hypothetical protein